MAKMIVFTFHHVLIIYRLAQKMVGTRCILQYCPNVFRKNAHVYFHKVRSDESMREKWMHALKDNLRPDVNLGLNSARICGAHFPTESFSLGTNGMGTTKLMP